MWWSPRLWEIKSSQIWIWWRSEIFPFSDGLPPLTEWLQINENLVSDEDTVHWKSVCIALCKCAMCMRDWGDSYFQKFLKLQLCMFPNCSHCFTGFRTYFVSSVAQLLPMVIVFFGFNGNFNGKMTKINKMAKNHFSGVQNGSQSV